MSLSQLHLLILLVPAMVFAETPRASTVKTLNAALSRTLTENPLVQSLPNEARAKDKLVEQASLHPNPDLEVTADQLGGDIDGVSPAQAEIRLSQRIERGGKREARIAAASAERTLALLDRHIEILELVSDLKKSWARVVSLSAERRLRREQLAHSRELVSAVRRRVEAGATLPAELPKAETAVQADEIELNRLEQEFLAEKQLLVSFWQGDAAEIADDLPVDPTPPNGFSGPQMKLGQLQLQRVDAQKAQAEQALSQERSKGVQDVTLAAGYQRLQGLEYDAVMLSFSMPLPVSDRNQGSILAAQHTVVATALKAANSRIKLETRLRSLQSTVRALTYESAQLTNAAIPLAERAFREHQSAFSLGKSSFLDVADAQRTLLALRGRALEVTRLTSEAVADIEVLTADEPLHVAE